MILLTLTQAKPADDQLLRGLDASEPKSAQEKASSMLNGDVVEVGQAGQLSNPDARVLLVQSSSTDLLEVYARSYQGLKSGDDASFRAFIWEVDCLRKPWKTLQSTVEVTTPFGGFESCIRWGDDGANVARRQGMGAWGSRGVAIAQMSGLPASIYCGGAFDSNVAPIVPLAKDDLAAIWCYCSSTEFAQAVRQIDQKVAVANATVVKVPFDRARWQEVADAQYPDGIPNPFSNNLTQSVFHGHPHSATDPLQVAVARLLGYRWPAERDQKMELSDEARAWVSRCANLDPLCDDDGIVCLPAVRGEAAAVDRLRALLARAFGTDWSAAREAALLRDAGCDGLPLAQWLRDKFFAQHVARFQKRPFIWHVWDGHKEGFSALLNVHTLTRAKLQTLIHTYLGDWITQQKRAVDAADATSSGDATLRLARAKGLNDKLEAILEGEAPYDIFVRWKPAHLQPIGWEPDLNDGVRMNIRPFVQAEVLRIPGRQLGIKWEPDRGKDVPSAPWFKLGPTYGEPEGTRINDHHLSLAEKHAARARLAKPKE